MAQETCMRNNHQNPKPHRQQRSTVTTTVTHEETEEFFEESIASPYRRVFDMAEKLATTRFGQFIMARGDRLLKVVETTAKWSLPQNQMNDKLQRPLPWIPFLMMLIALRLARVWVSLGAFLIGNAPVKAQDVVYFIQTRRRKLRALRLRGIKEICRRENDAAIKNSELEQITFLAKLKRVFSSAICRPGQHRETERRIMIHRGKEVICVETLSSEEQIAKRPRNDDCDADMTINDLLNKYANDNSENDSDFVPTAYEEESNDDSKSSSETTESSDESESQESQGPSTELNRCQENNKNNNHDHLKEKDSSFEFKENGNGEPIDIPKPIIEAKIEMNTDSESSATPKTPYENGPSNGADNREMDVEFKFVLTPPEVENGNKKLFAQTKPTNERRHATEMEQQLSSTLNTATATVPELISTLDLSSTNPSSDDVDSSTSKETDSYSPTLSAGVSSTTLDSTFIESANKPQHINDIHATATSTQNIEDQEEIVTIASVSSSEDDFYSPIGSPPDFNMYQQKQMNFKFGNLPQQTFNQSNTNNNYVPDLSQLSSFVPPTSASAPASAPVRRNHGHGQHRYRGRNRR